MVGSAIIWRVRAAARVRRAANSDCSGARCISRARRLATPPAPANCDLAAPMRSDWVTREWPPRAAARWHSRASGAASLPSGPDVRTDRANVAGGEDHQQRQTLRRLHHVGEGLGGFGVRRVARLGDLAHQEVIFDQPGDGPVRPDRARGAGRTCGRCGRRQWNDLPADPGDVVEEERHIEQARVVE